MRKIALLLTLLMSILIIGCNDENVQEKEHITSLESMEEAAELKDELKVVIESDTKGSFFGGVVNLTPVLEGKVEKELQYHWIIEGVAELGNDSLIDGFVGENGPVVEVINSGETVQFGVYAQVSYVEGAYSERKVILKVEEKDTGKVIATDELIIENREGLYTIKTSKDKMLSNTILKNSKARLYAEIFDTVWGIDSGLNSDVKYISVNTKSMKDFSEEDSDQLFEYLEKKYNVEVLDMSIDELEQEGYVKDLSFKDGILFEIDRYFSSTENNISFDGKKWASGMGAIGFHLEAKLKDGEWEIEKCGMTWIS